MVNKNSCTLTDGIAKLVIALYTILLYSILWHFPLDSMNALTTPIQDELFSDSNYYLYSAQSVCHQATWQMEDLEVTWSSIGVVGYLTVGCRLFGTEYFYILINPLLTVIAFSIGLRAARDCRLTPRISLLSIVLIPYTLLTISAPGKEVISFLGIMLVTSGLIRITCGVRFRLSIFNAFLGLILIAINRPHEAAAIVLFTCFWLGGLRLGWLRPIIAGTILLILQIYSTLIFETFQIFNSSAESFTDERIWSGSSEGKTLDVENFFSHLRSDNLILHVLLGILRVLVVLVGPLSSLVTPWSDSDLAYFIYRDLSQRLRIIDILFVAHMFWHTLRTPVSSLSNQAISSRWLLPSLFLFMIYVVTFFGVSQKSRYIFQYIPLLLIWYWCWNPKSTARC